MYQDAVPAGPFPSWQPKELGFTKATALSILLVAIIVLACLYMADVLRPPATPVPIQVTQATLTQLPQPTPPPPPPKVIPPPKPLPVVIPKPPPVPSKIEVPTKAPPPVKHYVKPIPHPIHTQPTPPPPVQPVTPPQPAAPPAPRTDGIPIYGRQMHAILEANQSVPPALAQLGVSGTAYIHIIVAPDGHVVSASVAKSSGIPLIDQTALDHALHANFAAFNANMPDQNLSIIVPIEIDGEDASQ